MMERIFELIRQKLNTKDYIIISIDGKSGSGKSSLSSMIESRFDCNVFHMDDFFLTPEMRTSDRLSEIGGNVDYIRFKTQVIDQLYKESFTYEKYACHTGTFSSSGIIKKKRLSIVEGVYSQHPMFGDIYDLKIFLTINDETQKNRILKRNGEIMLNRFINEWIPLENMYFENIGLLTICDLSINTSSL